MINESRTKKLCYEAKNVDILQKDKLSFWRWWWSLKTRCIVVENLSQLSHFCINTRGNAIECHLTDRHQYWMIRHFNGDFQTMCCARAMKFELLTDFLLNDSSRFSWPSRNEKVIWREGLDEWSREQLAWFFSASRHALIWLRLSSLPFLVPASMYLVRSPRAHNGHQMWKAACDLPPLITVGFPIEHYYRIDGGGLLEAAAKWVFHHDLCGPKLKAINLSARQKSSGQKVHICSSCKNSLKQCALLIGAYQ